VAGRALDAVIESVTGALKDGESVVLVGFGTFSVKDRAARTGRNPQTGKAIDIAAAKIPGFKAGKALKRDFAEIPSLQVSKKGPGDFVSEADKRAENILYQELSRARPGYGFVMEEAGVIEGSDKSHRWHIDPLDCTSNFLHGIPHFAISVGLEREGQMVAGVVLDVIKDEMFVAERGKGAYVNNRRLRVSGRREAAGMLIGTGIPHSREQLRQASRCVFDTGGPHIHARDSQCHGSSLPKIENFNSECHEARSIALPVRDCRSVACPWNVSFGFTLLWIAIQNAGAKQTNHC
jgi:fructose-1,6-bisphosphatase/inositol monophosphatase family enzyme